MVTHIFRHPHHSKTRWRYEEKGNRGRVSACAYMCVLLIRTHFKNRKLPWSLKVYCNNDLVSNIK